MPYKSRAQQKFFHAAEARGEISKKTVKEFDSATKGEYQDLPEHVKKAGAASQRQLFYSLSAQEILSRAMHGSSAQHSYGHRKHASLADILLKLAVADPDIDDASPEDDWVDSAPPGKKKTAVIEKVGFADMLFKLAGSGIDAFAAKGGKSSVPAPIKGQDGPNDTAAEAKAKGALRGAPALPKDFKWPSATPQPPADTVPPKPAA